MNCFGPGSTRGFSGTFRSQFWHWFCTNRLWHSQTLFFSSVHFFFEFVLLKNGFLSGFLLFLFAITLLFFGRFRFLFESFLLEFSQPIFLTLLFTP
jgi:hypothetical protein